MLDTGVFLLNLVAYFASLVACLMVWPTKRYPGSYAALSTGVGTFLVITSLLLWVFGSLLVVWVFASILMPLCISLARVAAAHLHSRT